MFCENCGVVISDDSTFCTACGAAVNSQVAAQPISSGASVQDALSGSTTTVPPTQNTGEYMASSNSNDYHRALNVLYEIPNPTNKRLLQMAWFLAFSGYVSVRPPKTPEEEKDEVHDSDLIN